MKKTSKLLILTLVLTMLMSLTAIFIVPASAETKTYSYTFTAKQFSSNTTKTLNNVSWTLAGDGGYWGYDATKGQQFGSGNKPYKSLTLTSQSLSNVKTIKINTSGAKNINASVSVSVGGTQVGSATKLTATATEYTFTATTPLSGEVKFTFSQTSSVAMYIKSIYIEYNVDAGTPACQHKESTAIGEAVEPTCTETGMTAGSKCANPNCDYVFEEQEVIPATGHSYEDGSVCTVCGHTAEIFTLVESASNLKVGDKIIIVATDYNYALSTVQNNNNRGQYEIKKDGNNIELLGDVQVITLEAGSVANTFAFYVAPQDVQTTNNYLYAASGSSNYLRSQNSIDANASWSITISDGVATIKANGSNSRNLLQYNSNSSIFSCYGSAQQSVSIYKLVDANEPICEHNGERTYSPTEGSEGLTHDVMCTLCDNVIETVSCEDVDTDADHKCDTCNETLASYTHTYDAETHKCLCGVDAPKGLFYVNGELVDTRYGDTIQLPTQEHIGDFTFVGWVKEELNNSTVEPTKFVNSYSFESEAEVVTFYAAYSYSEGESAPDAYNKVTEEPSDWSGTYLIVYEAGNVAFNGGLPDTTFDKASNKISVTINNNSIAASATVNSAVFVIEKVTGGYSIKSQSGYYIGNTKNDDNQVELDATNPYVLTITLGDNGTVDIVCGETHLRYNATSGQERFRFFKGTSYSSMKAVSLYKFVAGSGSTIYTTSPEIHEHSYDNDCDTTCNGCDYVREVEDHVYTGDWQTDGDYHWKDCDKCGFDGHKASHSAAAKTDCTANTVCSVCSYKIADGNAQHTWSDWTSTGETEHKHTCQNPGCNAAETANHTESTAANCTTSAYCDVCNSNYGSANINNHTYGTLIAKKGATCTVDGMEAHYHCACGAYFDTNKNATTADALKIVASHTYGDWNNEIPATCTSTGKKAHKTCSVCSKHFDNNGTEILDLTIAINASNHTGSANVVNNGTSDVHSKWSCCGATASAEHDMSLWHFDNDKHYAKCECGYISTTGANHSYAYTNNGDTHIGTCTCGAKKTEQHSGGDATCTTLAKCEICNNYYGSIGAHDWDSHVSGKDADCVNGGNNAYKHCKTCNLFYAEGAGDYASAQNDGKADKNKFNTNKLGHDWSDLWTAENNQHYHACTRSGCDGKNEIADCSGGTATCTEKAVCTTCGNTHGSVDANNHSFTNYVSDENATCTADGTKTAVCDRDGCDATDTVTDAGSKLGHQLCVTSFYRVDDAKLYTVTQCVRYGQGGCNYEVKTEVGVANVATEADLRLALEAGYSVKLTADIELSKGCIKITEGNEISINLNGKSIINNGVLKNNVIDVLWVCGDIDVTISGGGAMKALGVEKGKSTCVLSATDGATVVIENGSYYSDGCTTIFATRGSEIAINGGHFEAADASYLVDIDEREEGKPISTIVITGGEFVDFNPANHSNDGAANSNKLPDGYHSIKSGNVYTVGAHDYTYNEKVVDPTCEADGYTRHTCVCEDYYDDTPVAKHGHKDENHDHVCDNGCGVEQGTHAENNAHKCTYCGHTEAEWICRGGTATCTEKAICTVCGNAYGKALGHDFSNGHTCSRCGSEGVAKIGNTYYLDIKDAFDALQAGDTLVFNSHITLTDSIVISVSATLDTGDYVVTSTAREVIVINGEGVELTVNGKFVVSNTSAALMRTGGGSNVQTVLTIEDVNNVTVILNAEFVLGAEDILYSGDVKSGYSISVKAEYAAHLARFGYATTAGADGRVNVVERSPYYIGANGNWYMNGFDTGIKAEGQNGQNIVIDRVEEGDKVDNATTYTIYFNIGEPVVLTVYHGNDGADGRGIASIAVGDKEANGKLVAKVVTITYTKEIEPGVKTQVFEIPCGQDGQNGKDITIVGEPKVDHDADNNSTTYTVKFSNNTELSFTVQHGSNGAEGNGIKSIVTSDGEKGGVKGQWITISYTKSEDVSKFFIPNGVNGKPGSSVTVDTDRCTSSYDENTNSTTYTVYFTDDNYISFTVHHGTNGTDGNGISYVSVANGKHEGKDGQWITINYTKGESTEFFVSNGVNGGKGDSITIVGEPEVEHDVVKNSTKYTVNFSNGNSVSFTVQHGVDGKDGNGVKGIQVATDLENNGQWITIYYTKADAEGKSEETFFVPNGVNGTDGNGIDYVETDVDSKGNVLITINYTKSEAITVTIPKGDKGNGIQAIVSEVGTKDGVAGQWITITYTEGSETTKLFVPNGKDGANVTITKTEKTTVESVDTYTITFSDGTTVSFSVTHGIDGDKGDKGDQGDQGEAGKTPYIGENGNWWIGDKDLGIPATGSDGDSGETPYIGENGNWWIGETDTGIKAQGEDGRSNDVIILFTIGIAALCLLTTIVAVVTRKGRRSWWFIL